MIDTKSLLNNLAKTAKNKTYRFDRLYRILYNKNFYYKALSKLYPNKGAGTPGIDGKAVDGISEAEFEEIIESLKDESYQPKPVKRVYIPKKNGKERPLGLPTFRDKLVQEIIRVILDTIYEPLFSNSSHGFRENRSCQTALDEIKKTYKGVSWFIEGDIHGCFDNIDHDILIEILRKRIKDERFLNLIRKFLKAGYLENWKYHSTYSGCPQGSIIGPILANIYLNELDEFVENDIAKKFNKGKPSDRKPNKEYIQISNYRNRLKKKINNTENKDERKKLLEEYEQLGRKQREIPHRQPNQGEYRKLVYTRYADDWLIGVIGSKDDCRQIKAEIQEFLTKKLNLELSEEKTLITHSDKPAKFLGYEIEIRRNQETKECKNGNKKFQRRTQNRSVSLKIPKGKLVEIVNDKKLVYDINAPKWKPKPRPDLLYLSDLEILKVYDSELRGLYNYYSLADNVSGVMNNLHYLMEYSLLKTLAWKHKTTIGKYKRLHMVDSKQWGIKYQTKKGEKIAQLTNSFKQVKANRNSSIDIIPHNEIYTRSDTDLESRLKAGKCEICGAEGVPLEIHHTNKLKNLKGKAVWEQKMIAKRRKTLAVCHQCHLKIHNGIL